MTSKEDLEALYERIAAKEDRLDVLVANSGIPGPKADPAGETDAKKLKERLWPNENFEQWDEVHRTDISSIYCWFTHNDVPEAVGKQSLTQALSPAL